MGLKIHSLAQLPAQAGRRSYYLYLLDYGWKEPLGRTLHKNFDRMAGEASRHDAAVMMGLGTEFNDEVLSWHGINGREAGELLPAILITNKRPISFEGPGNAWDKEKDHLVLLPLRERCKTPTDVAALIDSVFSDIKAKRPLADFAVARRDRAGVKGALLDAVVLRPSIGGVGVDLKAIINSMLKRKKGA
jgi:hypothetical protein